MFSFLMEFMTAALALLGIHQYRNFWLYRPLSFTDSTPFDGTIYHVRNSEIIQRSGSPKASKTVICFPGFLENQHYFTELYQNQDIEFIAINNADYFSGFYSKQNVTPEWGKENPYKIGTIEHDAHLLCLTIENLASNDDILLHGHSRGGAVILEAARQNPKTTAKVTAMLEAPVLPKAKAAPGLERFTRFGGLYIFPLYLGFMRIIPNKFLITERAHYPLTNKKREVLGNISRIPKRYSTVITNMINIREWQQKSEFEVYDHFKEIRIVIPHKDYVLCRKAMHLSASQAEHVKIIETEDTNHFISLEQPNTMLAAAELQ